MKKQPKKKKKPQRREYKFTIDAFTPATIPMVRLAAYLTDLATMLGQTESVHFLRVEKGSTVPVIAVEYEAEPKVKIRLKSIKQKDAPTYALEAAKRIDDRLAEDNGIGFLLDPSGAKVVRFPGRLRFDTPEYGPITQQGTIQGVPIKIGGENDPVPVHIDDGRLKYIIHAKRPLAKEIAEHLFTTVVRISGMGRWLRNGSGEWQMQRFDASSVTPIENADIKKNVEELRNIQGDWKQLEDPLAELDRIRKGTKIQ
jgi:hypothetical protein